MWGKLSNGGQVGPTWYHAPITLSRFRYQICLCPDYILVPAYFQDALVEALKEAYHELHPQDPKTSGMLTRMVNTGHAERLKRLLDNTNGTVVFGGEVDVEKKYVEPTLVKDVRGDDSLLSEELFGPVLPIVPVKDVDEAIEFINQRCVLWIYLILNSY